MSERKIKPKAEPSDQAKTDAKEPAKKVEPPAAPVEGADGAGRRRRQGRLYALLGAALLVALMFQLNYLAFRHYERWDWTEHSIYTLSDRSKEVLRGLDTDVEIYVLRSESEPGFGDLRNLLGRYQSETDRIDVRYIDPDRDPGGYQEIARRFELGALVVGDSETQYADVAAVIVSGDRHWEVTREDLISQSFDSLESEGTIELNVEGERAITGALIELTTGEPTQVCLTRGHGELSVSAEGRSLSGFAAEMRRENLELSEIDTRGEARVPERCHVVAVMGPEIPFVAQEAQMLRAYVRGGGNLLVAVDPIPNRERTQLLDLGLESTLRDFGVEIDSSIVVEPNPALHPAGMGHPIGFYYVVGWGEHAITEPFRGMSLPLVAREARGVRPVDPERATVLVSTSDSSFAASLRSLADGVGDLGPENAAMEGPVPLAVATQVEVTGAAADEDAGHDHEDDESPGGRVVVVGDATMFVSELLEAPTIVNRNFASAIMGWLSARRALIAIEARTIEQRPVTISDEQVNDLFFRVVVMIPAAFIFLGFAVWWNRRQ